MWCDSLTDCCCCSHHQQNCEREDLPNVADEDPIWEATAHSLAGLCASLVLVVSPERIVLSGGVMNRTILYAKVRRACCRRALVGHVLSCSGEVWWWAGEKVPKGYL